MRLVRHEPIMLLVGDLVVFYTALWLTLFVRHFELPSSELWLQHAIPFSLLFVISVIVYFISGLYDQHTSFLRNRLPSMVAYGQTVTVILAALFFFLIPYFGITPKTILLIFLALSSVLIVVWRLFLTRFIGVRDQAHALVIGEGREIDELIHELNATDRYGITVQHQFAPKDIEVSSKLQEQILEFITKEKITVIIVNTRDPYVTKITPVFYNLLFLHPKLRVLDALRIYEDIFRRVPISMLEDTWFIEHITRTPPFVYNAFHRLFDIIISLLLGAVTLVLFPLIALLVRREDNGSLFYYQQRVGKDNQPLDLVKFRTMTVMRDHEVKGPAKNRVTHVGVILRNTRIDELPQLWNVLRGGYSLIGPRPEIPVYVKEYAEAIPYYNARHLITPGLSGWAQLNHHEHPHHGVDIQQTRNKLSYDLYYLKNRSLLLDLEIGLKTIKTLLTAVGK